MILYGSQITQHSPWYTQFTSWLQERKLHKNFIGTNITVFPILSPVLSDTPREISAIFYSWNLFSPFHFLRSTTLSIYSALIIQIFSLTCYESVRIQISPKRNLKITFSKSVNCVKTTHITKFLKNMDKYFHLNICFGMTNC